MNSLLSASRSLLAYTLWADAVQLRALEQVAAADLERETGASFGSLLATMAHILVAERKWLARFLGMPLDPEPELGQYADLPSLLAGFQEFSPELEYFMASLTEEQLAAEIAVPGEEGGAAALPLWQALAHLVNHGTYHRGQVTTLLRQLGYTPPATDLDTFFLARRRP
ncbi:MAG: DinB family protein [Acidobacteriota bacterium]